MTALILVDLQNDFMPGGTLPVPHGDEVLSLANRLTEVFQIVVATQDWHPTGHSSFASRYPGAEPGEVINIAGVRQELWPDHCVQNTPGAELHSELDQSNITRVFHKGTDPEIDSYSTFFDSAQRNSTGLKNFLRGLYVNNIYIMGLATEYCVKFSVLDAMRLGFVTHVIEDGCRGIDSCAGDVQRALDTMVKQGAKIVTSQEVVSSLSALEDMS